jgi:hypothetical protein
MRTVVLGMHRSGTSALTRVLQLMGFWAGDEDAFAPANFANPTGYWEHREVFAVDEAALRCLGATWCDLHGFDLARLDGASRARLLERARGIAAEMDRHGPWVIKDPRLCLLLPLWRRVLERPICILVHRSPLAVAASLAARDGLPIPFGIALWELYNREALAASAGLPRLLVSYHDLLELPEATVERLHRDLCQLAAAGAPEPDLRVPSREELLGFLRTDLDHHPPDPERERGYLNPRQVELRLSLDSGEALTLDPLPPLSEGARDLLAAPPDALGAENAARLDRLERELRRTEGWVGELDGLLAAVFASRSWRLGYGLTGALRRLLGRKAEPSAAERHARLQAEIRSARDGE